MPVLTPLQLSITRRHMVVVREYSAGNVTYYDPLVGGEVIQSEDKFKTAFSGQVIAILR